MSNPAAGRAGSPDYSRGYLRVPLDVWLGTFCRGTLTRRQLQLVAVVLRESWGWHDREGRPYTWTRPLSSAAFSRLTGIAPDHARREVRGLLSRGVLAEAAGRYRFVLAAERAGAPTRAEGPVNRSAGAAETGGPEPVPKTAKDSQTNVAPDRPAAFAALLAGFAGPLPPREAARLRRWVEREGVAAVWTQLGAAFQAGPEAARAALLAARAGRPQAEDDA